MQLIRLSLRGFWPGFLCRYDAHTLSPMSICNLKKEKKKRMALRSIFSKWFWLPLTRLITVISFFFFPYCVGLSFKVRWIKAPLNQAHQEKKLCHVSGHVLPSVFIATFCAIQATDERAPACDRVFWTQQLQYVHFCCGAWTRSLYRSHILQRGKEPGSRHQWWFTSLF